MHRLSPVVRSALLGDAASSAQSTIRRWSLQALANINGPPPPSSSIDNGSQRGGGSSKSGRGGPPKAEAAETLLHDVKLRLAGQHSRTLEMTEHAEAIADATSKKRQSNPLEPAQQSGVVRAVNSPVGASLKAQLQSYELSQLEQRSALDGLSDLEILHADTYKLVHDLLDNGAPTLRRWSGADRSLVAATFESVRSRHATSVETLADAVIGLRRSRSLAAGRGIDPVGQFCGIDLRLIDDFLRARLGVQLLCDHYVALDKGKLTGGIAVGCDLGAVVEDAVTEARHVCDANLGVMPDVVVGYGMGGRPGLPRGMESMVDCGDAGLVDGINVTLIRPWLHHSLVEILKNALASSVQRAEDRNDRLSPPEVHVRLMDGVDSVAVVVMDQGVGLTEDRARRAFRFAETSSLKRWDRIEEQTSYAMVRAPLGSLGVGLPLSRMMMQMFGGDVMVSNREKGEGLDSGCTAVVKLLRDDTFIEGVTDIGADGISLEQA